MNLHLHLQKNARPILLILLLAIVTSCTYVPHDATDSTVDKTEAQPPVLFPFKWYQAKQSLPASRVYRIEPSRSQLKVKVYREGRLAKYGHNHIVSSNNINGMIYIDEVFSKSRVDVYIPVKSLIVDDPLLRANAGEGFATHLTEQDSMGTRNNMLSDRVLNINQHPYLFLAAAPKNDIRQHPELVTDITIGGNKQTLTHSAKLEMAEDNLLASGEFTIRQTDFGIEPFSVMLGALRVKDELEIEYRIKARLLR